MNQFLKQTPGIGGLDEITDAEELFLQNLTGLSYAAGDILYHNGSDMVRLAIGTASQVLQTNAGATAPEWGNAGADVKVGIDSVATSGYLGAANSDGVLRTSSPITYTDGGDFITLAITKADTTNSGYLDTTDWDTFNDKQASDAALTSISDLTYVSGSFIALTANDTYGVRTYAQTLTDIGGAATNQTMYIGTTAVAINRGTAALTLAGITLTTPDLGTPSTLVGTNISGTGASFTSGAVTGYTPASGSLTLVGADALTITTSAATNVTLPTSGTLLANVVEDTTPQLGGMLDVNGQAIGDGTLELLKFSETASAVNEITITNAATAGAPKISATGGDANIDLELTAKGTGKIKQDAIYQTPQTHTPAGAATATLDLSTGNEHRITMPSGNITIAISNETDGQKFIISVLQDGTGSRTVTWFSTIKWAGGSAPTLTTTASKRDVFGFIVTGADTYDGFVVGANI